MLYRDCKWLSDDLKEEYLENVKLVEKAVLRAVLSFPIMSINLQNCVLTMIQFK